VSSQLISYLKYPISITVKLSRYIAMHFLPSRLWQRFFGLIFLISASELYASHKRSPERDPLRGSGLRIQPMPSALGAGVTHPYEHEVLKIDQHIDIAWTRLQGTRPMPALPIPLQYAGHGILPCHQGRHTRQWHAHKQPQRPFHARLTLKKPKKCC
jgi:hypothetical protein